ncbi:putative pentatricopeptide repeat-containing protein At1g12700, mitochondrial [Alnus glutinosa]|uniref:putative pentatricopeptide repeat-containing protein At1g12700, mitochondrial n=1 Tax=Alnus glutinosa TaxID=3517 RepID=UPI002D78FB41|nr:putative pentatricopeptide repeat-containing protein At1g12700, mitochondrial [Alnus glutinosa]
MGTIAKSRNSLAFFFYHYCHSRDSFHRQNFYYCCSFSATSSKTTNSGRDIVESPNHFLKSARDWCRSRSLRNLDDALGLFDRMLHIHPLPSIVDFTQLLTAIARMKHHSIVISLIKEIELSGIAPDVYTLGILINCFCHLNWVDCDFSILARILKLGFQPNYIILNPLVKGIYLRGKIAEAMNLVNKMEKISYKPDIATYGTIMNCLCKIGKTNEAIELLRKMDEGNLNVVIILIDGMCNAGKLTTERELFNTLLTKGSQANVQTYTIMIKGLCKEGLLKEVMVLFEQMEENGCSPNHFTYNTIIQGFLQHNETSWVVKYIKMMVDEGFSANATTATILINLLSTNQDPSHVYVLGVLMQLQQIA